MIIIESALSKSRNFIYTEAIHINYLYLVSARHFVICTCWVFQPYVGQSSCMLLLGAQGRLAEFFLCSSAVDSSDISYDKEEETVTITFPSSLPVGKCQLHLDYTGELNDKMKGFYRSKYTSADGEEKYCAVTQFEVSIKLQYK